MLERPRRLRRNRALRDLVHETSLNLSQLVQPFFLSESPEAKEPIPGFTNVFRWGAESLSRQMESQLDTGIRSFLLFGSTTKKDEIGSGAYEEQGVLPQTLRVLKRRFGDKALFFTDVCLCPFTSHGHCGVLEEGHILNDESFEPLSRMAVVHAEAGADVVAPSDMMDGRIGVIRRALDDKGYLNTGILAYSAKYASAYYGPFREALGSAPKGDRATYQMDFRNTKDAERELRLDISEGADIVMVKPALSYLDIIAKFRQISDVPIAAYSVSGEYEMVKRLAACGMADERKLAMENLTAIRRAGAQIIVTYFAGEIAEKGWLRE